MAARARHAVPMRNTAGPWAVIHLCYRKLYRRFSSSLPLPHLCCHAIERRQRLETRRVQSARISLPCAIVPRLQRRGSVVAEACTSVAPTGSSRKPVEYCPSACHSRTHKKVLPIVTRYSIEEYVMPCRSSTLTGLDQSNVKGQIVSG